jgi:hypothetical protein
VVTKKKNGHHSPVVKRFIIVTSKLGYEKVGEGSRLYVDISFIRENPCMISSNKSC